MSTLMLRVTAVGALTLIVMLAGCERPPMQTEQYGYAGVGMEGVTNERLAAKKVAMNQAPEPEAPATPAGLKARDVYQNVQVLGDLDIQEFNRLMRAITEWVSPEQGCNYCHVQGNFADDSVYAKKVSRTMLQMTQRVNTKWSTHVADTGVTCYTCHRGNNVPEYVWYEAPERRAARGFTASNAGQNMGGMSSIGYASLPYDPFTPFLEEYEEIRVQNQLVEAPPPDTVEHIKKTEYTYALMMHMSQSLGANCTLCHNSRSWSNWEESTPQRVQSWYGIQAVRDMNRNYVLPTTEWLPEHRLGPMGDPAKINCSTCHQGIQKPLYGAKMVEHYPSLRPESTDEPSQDMALQ